MRRLWSGIALLLLLGSVATHAEEKKVPRLDLKKLPGPEKGMAYEDLPGVMTPEELEASRADGFKCTTVLRRYRRDNTDGGFRYSLPERVYQCEKNGVVFESSSPPARGAWLPGINPPDDRR